MIRVQSNDGTTEEDINRDLADGSRDDVGQSTSRGLGDAQDSIAMAKNPAEAIRALTSSDGVSGTNWMGNPSQFLGWVEFHEEQMGNGSHLGHPRYVRESPDD